MKKFKNNAKYLLIISLLCAISCNDKQIKDANEQVNSVITENVNPVEEKSEFLFVGMYYGKPGILKYSLKDKKYKPVFAVQREKVISLNYNNDLSSVFFITISKSGVRNGMPFVNKVKLYRINQEDYSVEKIQDLGNCSQLLAQWNDDGNYEVLLTSIDKKISHYFNVKKETYNTFGRLIDEKIETYDIIKDGYPLLQPQRVSTISPSGKYGVSVIQDSFFLKTAGEDSLKFIITSNLEINKISWNETEDYLFFSTSANEDENLSSKKLSELISYSIKGDSITAKWDGKGLKNFINFNNLFIFDDGLNYQSHIKIFNYFQNKVAATIKVRGGCGLINIPN